VSEYQYYKFERLDGYLDAKARQALRAISSRAEISATSFQVLAFQTMARPTSVGFQSRSQTV